MKKHNSLMVVFSVLMAVMLLLSACAPAAPAASSKAVRVAVIMPSATTDMAFSQSMWTALKAVQAEMGGESALALSGVMKCCAALVRTQRN